MATPSINANPPNGHAVAWPYGLPKVKCKKLPRTSYIVTYTFPLDLFQTG